MTTLGINGRPERRGNAAEETGGTDMEENMALEMETVETLEAAALHLAPADRGRLVARLIATLDVDPEVKEAWAAEVERRHAEIDSGAVSLLAGPETLVKLKAEFQ
jgi:Putative addiction module component